MRLDLSGKTVLPFVTYGVGRDSRWIGDMEKAAPGADFRKGFVVSGNRFRQSYADVEKWLREAGVIK